MLISDSRFKPGFLAVVPVWSLFLCWPVLADVPVVREGSQIKVSELPQAVRSSKLSQNPESSKAVWLLLDEMEQLKQEVQGLRGLVETQNNQIDRLNKRQQQHYLDLDTRVRQLTGEADPDGANVSAPSSSEGDVALAAGSSEAGPDENSERGLYQIALKHIKAREYPQAQQALERVLTQYPEGLYQVYANYWLGEISLVLSEPNYSQAIGYFRWVVENNAEHRKAPLSYYKLGTLYDAVGEPKLAKKHLDTLIATYPSSPEAKRAIAYLADREER